MRQVIIAFLTFICLSAPIKAQVADVGILPFRSYDLGGIDSINVNNGNLVLQIPLLSYPQAGTLPNVGLSLNYNAVVWDQRCNIYDATNGYTYCQWETSSGTGLGVGIVLDNDLKTELYSQCPDVCGGWWLIDESNGAQHPTGSVDPTFDNWVSSDATGFRIAGNANGLPGGLFNRSGIRFAYNSATGLYDWYDPSNNSVKKDSSVPGQITLTDSLQRTIPVPLAGAGCRTTFYSSSLGPNSAPYVFCYESRDFQSSIGTQDDPPFCQIAEGDSPANPLSSVTLPDGTSRWQFEYDDYGDLTKITLPTGGTITYEWQLKSSFSCNNLSATNRRVVSRTVNPVPGDPTQEKKWQYAYSGTNTPCGGDLTSPGPSKTVVCDPDGNRTIHTFGGPVIFAELFSAQTALESLTEVYDSQLGFLQSTEKGYVGNVVTSESNPLNGMLTVVPKTVKTTLSDGRSSIICTIYDNNVNTDCAHPDGPDPSGPAFATSMYTDNIWAGLPIVYGSPLYRYEYDFDVNNGGLLRTTQNQFEWETDPIFLNANRLDHLSSTTIIGVKGDGTQGQAAQTSYGYDSTGNQTSVTRWLNNGPSPQTSTQYNPNGMPSQTADARQNPILYGYDDSNVYLSAITYPTPSSGVQQIESYTFDHNTGLMTSHQDRNLQPTGFSYTNMRRPDTITYPDGGSTKFYYDSPTSFHADQLVDFENGVHRFSYGFVDGLGRQVRTAVTDDEPNAGTGYAVVDTCYDFDERVSFRSYPYQAAAVPTGPTVCSGSGDAFTYDALGRVTSITHADGSVILYTYTGPCTLIADEQQKKRQTCTDALGRLISVTEDPGGSNYVTTYGTGQSLPGYDALDNLLTVSQSNSRQRWFFYDSLSRLTKSINPESGQTQYSYDANGNLLTKLDANQVLTNYQPSSGYMIDALNRVTGITYTINGIPTTTPSEWFTYDQAPSGYATSYSIGRLTANGTVVSGNSNVSAVFGYDKMGRIAADTHIVGTPPISKTTLYYYNRLGSIDSIVYPSGNTISYKPYNAANKPTHVTDTTSGITYVSNAHYTASGAPCLMMLGSIIAIDSTFNSRMQLNRLQATTDGTPPTTCTGPQQTGNLLDLTYDFHLGLDNGNVWSITNNRDSTRSQVFVYDSINRLWSANTVSTYSSNPPASQTNCWSEMYDYDLWGNLRHITPQGGDYTRCKGESLGVAVTTNNQIVGYGYDGDGNLLNIPSVGSFSYDSKNQLASAGGFSYAYDLEGNRTQKSDGFTYWRDTNGEVLDESDAAGNIINEYIYFGGKRVARKAQ